MAPTKDWSKNQYLSSRILVRCRVHWEAWIDESILLDGNEGDVIMKVLPLLHSTWVFWHSYFLNIQRKFRPGQSTKFSKLNRNNWVFFPNELHSWNFIRLIRRSHTEYYDAVESLLMTSIAFPSLGFFIFRFVEINLINTFTILITPLILHT